MKVPEQLDVREPIQVEAIATRPAGGPGVWTAMVTVVATVSLVCFAGVTTAWDVQRDRSRVRASNEVLAEVRALAGMNQTLLEELRAAIAAGPAATQKAILDLINDNRRVHGCLPVESFDQLTMAPSCARVPVVLSTPPSQPASPVAASPPPPSVPPAPAPPASPRTTAPCRLGLLGVCLIS